MPSSSGREEFSESISARELQAGPKRSFKNKGDIFRPR